MRAVPDGDAAEGSGAFGDLVDVVFDAFGQGVVEQVKLVELGALDVPVGLLGLA